MMINNTPHIVPPPPPPLNLLPYNLPIGIIARGYRVGYSRAIPIGVTRTIDPLLSEQ